MLALHKSSATCSRTLSKHCQRNFFSRITYSCCRQDYSTSFPKARLPEASWDSHMHVIDPDQYPFPPNVKPPKAATLSQALSNAERIGIPNLVFVQVSTYGNDNTWILDALKTVGPGRGRGVVAFDPDRIDDQTLQNWHRLGVRGIRLNFRSSKTVVSKTEIQTMLRKYAARLRPLETWSIGLYADMEILQHVEPLVQELQTKIVLEHFGSPSALPIDYAKQPGWSALQSMMKDPQVYTKISAPYLFSRDTDLSEFKSLFTALVTARNGDGVVFGSDWPHTQSRGYDIIPFMEKVLDWCNGDSLLVDKVFRDNAKVLWDV